MTAGPSLSTSRSASQSRPRVAVRAPAASSTRTDARPPDASLTRTRHPGPGRSPATMTRSPSRRTVAEPSSSVAVAGPWLPVTVAAFAAPVTVAGTASLVAEPLSSVAVAGSSIAVTVAASKTSSTGIPAVCVNTCTGSSSSITHTGCAVAVSSRLRPTGRASGQAKYAPDGTVTGSLGTTSSRPSSSTANWTPSWAGSVSTGWWLLTNRKPERPSERTHQRSVSRSAVSAGAPGGMVSVMVARSGPSVASHRCCSRRWR